MDSGCVHIYTGDGKGKTTAAIGLAVRAAGAGLRVGFFQFLKGSPTAELVPLAKLGVVVVSPPGDGKFLWNMGEEERAACAEKQQATLARAMKLAQDLDLLVLDEAIAAENTGMLQPGTLEKVIHEKPKALELVLTGRDAPKKLLALADYATKMKSLSHPYDRGLAARPGIEF